MLIGIPSKADSPFSLALAKNQEPLLLFEGKALQSRYNPRKEARVWAGQQKIGSSTVLILGDPLGYATHALQELHPGKKILGLSAIKHIFQPSADENPALKLPEEFFSDNYWRPGLKDLRSFLMDHLNDRQVLSIHSMNWPRSIQLLPEIVRHLTDQILNLAKERQKSLLQQKYFGPRMLANALMQDSMNIKHHTLQSWSHPTLLLASGPSLGKHSGFLQKYQDRFIIAALSSSLRSLAAWGIKPDLIFSMDPGYASSIHLRYAPESSKLVLPPTGYPQAYYNRFTLIPYSTGSLMEDDFFSTRSWSVPSVFSKGTVTLAAMDLLHRWNQDETYVLGFDLAYEDLLSHSWPHNWSWETHLQSSRINPCLGDVFSHWLKDAHVPLTSAHRTSPSLSDFGLYLNRSQDYHKSRIALVEPLIFPHQAFDTRKIQKIIDIGKALRAKPDLKTTALPQKQGSLSRHLKKLKPENYPQEWRDYLCDAYYWSHGSEWRFEILEIIQVLLERKNGPDDQNKSEANSKDLTPIPQSKEGTNR